MRWTIGMPSFNNFDEVYFTVQSLRLYHDLTDCEIVIVDNFGDDKLKDFCKQKGGSVIRYDRCNEIRGVSVAKNCIFNIARGEYVLCMDSHILLKPGALDSLPPGDDFVQGPLLANGFKLYGLQWRPVWRANMWGTWDWIMSECDSKALNDYEKDEVKKLITKGDFRIAEIPTESFEIWATGAGFFCCRRDSWLGFNPAFRGFGGETGYIQEKYRKAGRKVWCDPSKIWVHHFANCGRAIPFPIPLWERVRNYIIGFQELGLNTASIKDHFGPGVYLEAMNKLSISDYNSSQKPNFKGIEIGGKI